MCQARFRGTRICSRCGADLKSLMFIAAKAWTLREAARQAIEDGDFYQAAEFAEEAQLLHQTPAGKALRAVCDIMIAEAGVKL